MANMEVTDRSQYERHDLGSTEGLRRGAGRGMAIYMVFAVVIAAALSYAALSAIDSWAQWLVLAVIILTTVGITIAINPGRRAAG